MKEDRLDSWYQLDFIEYNDWGFWERNPKDKNRLPSELDIKTLRFFTHDEILDFLLGSVSYYGRKLKELNRTQPSTMTVDLNSPNVAMSPELRKELTRG